MLFVKKGINGGYKMYVRNLLMSLGILLSLNGCKNDTTCNYVNDGNLVCLKVYDDILFGGTHAEMGYRNNGNDFLFVDDFYRDSDQSSKLNMIKVNGFVVYKDTYDNSNVLEKGQEIYDDYRHQLLTSTSCSLF